MYEGRSKCHSTVYHTRLFATIIAIRLIRHSLFTTGMSRSRYFPNPYRANEEKASNKSPNFNQDLGDAREHMITIINNIKKNMPASSASPEGGLYVGSAGITYALLHISSQLPSELDSLAKEFLSLAQYYLEPSLCDLKKRGNRVDCGFLTGDAGVIAVCSVLANRIGDKEKSEAFAKRYLSMAEFCKPVAFLRCGSDEFFVGRAGYLYGSLWLNKQLGRDVIPVELMYDLARTMVQSGKSYAQKHSSPCPLMYAYYNTEYLGAAHGLASILQVLIQVPGFLDTNKDTETLVRTSVDYLLSLETSSGNYSCTLDEIDTRGCSTVDTANELVHWCHGSPGVVYLMAAAYLRWNDRRYLEACQRAGELVWCKGLLKKGPGICHGVAGNGYVFLLLYRLTSDHRHLRRALQFFKFLMCSEFKARSKEPDNPYSLYEGLAGTACYLADLAQPEKAAFPFQDVF